MRPAVARPGGPTYKTPVSGPGGSTREAGAGATGVLAHPPMRGDPGHASALATPGACRAKPASPPPASPRGPAARRSQEDAAPMPRPGPLSLNTATVKQRWGLAECIAGCVRHGIPGLSTSRDALADMGVQRAARRLREAGLTVTGLVGGGLLTAADAAGRRAALGDTRRAIEQAHALEARRLVVVCGGLPPGSKDLAGARAMVRDGLAEVVDEARAAGVVLALEPQHPVVCADRSVVCTLAQALDLCDALGAGVGVTLDVYHVWWDPDLARQIARAQGRIALFQASDWLAPAAEFAPDRGMPGDGVIAVPRLRAMAEAAGYKGPIEVEVLSRRWWARDPDEVLRVVKERHARAC